jgi:hypothetical protein
MNAPIRPSDCIGELCIALAHRWEPERLFVIFTAYFDEADTHGPAPTVILAAHVGHAYQWRQFEKKLARLQERYGFLIFHAKDFKGRSGEFSGWSEEKCGALIADLTQLIRNNLTGGLTVALEHSRYINEYRAPPIPKKMNLDSQLGVCFRACMSNLLDVLEARGYRDTLNIVMERGHRNVFDCERIFNELKGYFRLAQGHFLREFTVASKETCAPLMVADLLAATNSMLRARLAQGTLDLTPLVANPARKGAKLSFMELRPDALVGLKTGFEKMRQRKIELWRERRDAMKPSSSGVSQ